MRARRDGDRTPAVVVLLCFVVLAVAGTWPLTAHLTSRVPVDLGDPILNTWILWWNAHATPLTDRWWNAPFLVPMHDAMALSEHLLGISVFTTPMQWGGATPLVSYNVALLLSYALSGFFAYLLVLRVTGSSGAAWFAGVAFAFSPYRAGQLSHVQVLTAQWMPLMLLGLHQYLTTPGGRTGWLVLFGAAWLLQALSNGYFLLFLPALIVPWLMWFVDWRRNRGAGITIVAAWVIASLPLLPILLRYRQTHEALGLARSLGDIRQFSATSSAFAQASPLLAFWPAGSAGPEHFLFPGITPLLVTAIALGMLVARREIRTALRLRSPLLFYSAATLLMWALALGPGGPADGPPAFWRPYSWLLWLPGFDGLRVPARFAMLGTMTLSVAAAVAVARLAPAARRARAAFILIVLAGLITDGMMERVPLVVPPARLALEDNDGSTVFEIPADDPMVNAAAMYRQISHQRPLISGYTGHTPPHYDVLAFALARSDTSIVTALARHQPLTIVVNDRADANRGFRKLIETMPGIRLETVSAVGPVFRLPKQPPRQRVAAGKNLDAQLAEPVDQRLVVDLRRVQAVAAIQFNMGGRLRDLGERILIEASDDGTTWRQVWLGWTGEFAFEATLRDPALVPVQIPLPDARSRYLRIYPAPAWLKDELKVLGATP
jgi:hypothetical protein